MDYAVINWLLEGDSWQRFAVETQLLNIKAESSIAIREEKIQSVIRRLSDSQVGITALKTGKVAYTSTGNAFWDLFFFQI